MAKMLNMISLKRDGVINIRYICANPYVLLVFIGMRTHHYNP